MDQRIASRLTAMVLLHLRFVLIPFVRCVDIA